MMHEGWLEYKVAKNLIVETSSENGAFVNKRTVTVGLSERATGPVVDLFVPATTRTGTQFHLYKSTDMSTTNIYLLRCPA